jgi:hypothetical protein
MVSFAQLPVSVSSHRLQNGGKGAEKVCTLLQEKANWSALYAKSLAGSARSVCNTRTLNNAGLNSKIHRTNIEETEIPNSSTQHLFRSLRHYVNTDAQQHHQVSKKLLELVQVRS